MKFRDKVIVVTGASYGIGCAVATALVHEGASVVFAARSADKLHQAVSRATAAGGVAMAVPMDVTSDESVAAAIAAVLQRFGRIDVVINNAGNGGRLDYWVSTSASATRDMFDVHVLGTERVMRAVLPSMLERGAGTIVNIASTVAWVPMPGAAAYSAAKAAVVSLSETLRAELAGKGIDVRVFAPPHTSTEAGENWPLDLPKMFTTDWVAAALIRYLKGKRARAIPGGNGVLLLIQRISPRLAARIMNGVGFRAVAKCLAASASPARSLPPATVS